MQVPKTINNTTKKYVYKHFQDENQNSFQRAFIIQDHHLPHHCLQ